MKYKLLIVSILIAAGCKAQFLSSSYGAKGDGKTDDTKALNACIAAAVKVKGSTMDLGSGTYLCNQVAADQSILSLNGTFINGLTIKGEGAAILTSSVNSILLYAYAFAPGQGLRIDGVAFKSTHPVTTSPTTAVFIQGTGAQDWSDISIGGCSFDGFNVDIGAQGVSGLWVVNDWFDAIRGHDDAENNETPAVFIWLYDNQNGYCDSIQILDNVANGHTGTGPVSALTTQRPMDGFVFGVAYNIVIRDNQTRNLAEEHYFLHPATRPIAHTTEISNNELNCSIPAGSRFQNAPLTSNYGIRVDDNNVAIRANNLTNYTWGIISRACDYPAATFTNYYPPTTFINYVIDGNDLSQATDSAYKPQQGVYIVGPITGLRITNNTFRGATVDPILIYNASAAEYNNVKF